MGATNSKPQTVQIVNPTPFHITRDVAERIERSAGGNTLPGRPDDQRTPICEKCSQKESSAGSFDDTSLVRPSVSVPSAARPKEDQSVSHKDPVAWNKRSAEIEEVQFGKSLQRVQEMFGNSVHWAKDCLGEINNLEKELVLCYQTHPGETLQCAQLAKQYHRFIFAKQAAEVARPKRSP
ncbi:hypothetical protein KR018_009824, partial [Drosophila ironensis]